ncbi:ketopantoate reductase family protein [Ottowia sp. VDI28]|uniref:ketopantoate reductase family protein n=1 Tax=Ottowia sp. VDI28 TaxID=3133968 RepID=UPI003C2FBE91
MNIAIVGAGAIGSRMAAHLLQSGVSCALLDGWTEHVAALNQNGLRIRRHDREARFPVQAFNYAAPPDKQFDIILLAVRSDATIAALPLVKRLLAPEGFVVSCQNGLNEEEIAAAFGPHRTAGCSMIFGAKLIAPGVVSVLDGADTLRLGEFSGEISPRIVALAQTMSVCGRVSTTANLLGYRWMKLVLNATGNPLLLLSGLDGERLHDRPAARRLIIALASEIIGIAVKEGVQLEPLLSHSAETWLLPNSVGSEQLHECLLLHGRSLGTRRLSMVADFEARGRTEVGEITGKIVEKARRLQWQAPLNTEVLRLVRALEANQIKPGLPILTMLESKVGP